MTTLTKIIEDTFASRERDIAYVEKTGLPGMASRMRTKLVAYRAALTAAGVFDETADRTPRAMKMLAIRDDIRPFGPPEDDRSTTLSS